MSSQEETIVSLLARASGVPREKIVRTTRLREDLGIDGDDAAELLLELVNLYSLDATDFEFAQFFNPEPSLLTILGHFFPVKRQKKLVLSMSLQYLIEAVSLRKLA
jgi:acyl carrier protein